VQLPPLTVAAGQAIAVAEDIAANVATAAALVRRAAGKGAAILVLPELFLTGYELGAIAARRDELCVGVDDARLERLREACAETGVHVMAGAPTLSAEDGRLYISALVYDGAGEFVTRYDKQWATDTEQKAGFSRGAGPVTLEVDGWKLGLGICADTNHPDHARSIAEAGCRAYLVGSLMDEVDKRTLTLPRRASDNGMYVVFANYGGPSGPYLACGRSAVWDREGRALAEAGPTGTEVVVATLTS
jgi:predicted amidohydrolase